MFEGKGVATVQLQSKKFSINLCTLTEDDDMQKCGGIKVPQPFTLVLLGSGPVDITIEKISYEKIEEISTHVAAPLPPKPDQLQITGNESTFNPKPQKKSSPKKRVNSNITVSFSSDEEPPIIPTLIETPQESESEPGLEFRRKPVLKRPQVDVEGWLSTILLKLFLELFLVTPSLKIFSRLRPRPKEAKLKTLYLKVVQKSVVPRPEFRNSHS